MASSIGQLVNWSTGQLVSWSVGVGLSRPPLPLVIETSREQLMVDNSIEVKRSNDDVTPPPQRIGIKIKKENMTYLSDDLEDLIIRPWDDLG